MSKRMFIMNDDDVELKRVVAEPDSDGDLAIYIEGRLACYMRARDYTICLTTYGEQLGITLEE